MRSTILSLEKRARRCLSKQVRGVQSVEGASGLSKSIMSNSNKSEKSGDLLAQSPGSLSSWLSSDSQTLPPDVHLSTSP